jgi:hypothetical protein
MLNEKINIICLQSNLHLTSVHMTHESVLNMASRLYNKLPERIRILEVLKMR